MVTVKFSLIVSITENPQTFILF